MIREGFSLLSSTFLVYFTIKKTEGLVCVKHILNVQLHLGVVLHWLLLKSDLLGEQ